jgi:hypothetical protein
MEISFTPSPDVAVIINTLLDKFENRAKRNTEHMTRSIKAYLSNIPLPTYFSQIDPAPRLIANDQLTQLEHAHLITLTWLPGETGHLLEFITLTNHEPLYTLIHREPASIIRSRLETTLLADQFRFSKDDWRTRAIQRTLKQLRAGKSPTPFSLADSTWNLDLLTVLSALSSLETETPYRAFSVRTFNDSKRFDDLKSAIVRLARLTNREWKSLSGDDILHELNLVANPSYIYLTGNWQLTTYGGEVLSLGGFIPSVGFSAAQIETVQSITIHAESALCIENLTSFHEFIRNQETFQRNAQYATICIMGNPSPPIRRLLCLIPETIPIHLWADMDYGGFNILSQLRRYVRHQIHPYLMDISTFEKYAHLSHPLTGTDIRNLKRLSTRPELAEIRSTIEHLIRRGLKLEQEAIQI